jgi:hypothetical protein
LSAVQNFVKLMLHDRATSSHVCYRREAWISSTDNSVALPSIVSAPRAGVHDPFHPSSVIRWVFGNLVVVELKFTGRFPTWFNHSIQPQTTVSREYADGVALRGEHYSSSSRRDARQVLLWLSRPRSLRWRGSPPIDHQQRLWLFSGDFGLRRQTAGLWIAFLLAFLGGPHWVPTGHPRLSYSRSFVNSVGARRHRSGDDGHGKNLLVAFGMMVFAIIRFGTSSPIRSMPLIAHRNRIQHGLWHAKVCHRHGGRQVDVACWPTYLDFVWCRHRYDFEFPWNRFAGPSPVR